MFEEKNNKKFHLLVWFSVIINFIFKLYKIDDSPFSYDEIVSVKDTLLDFGHIKHESEWDSNPPFYYYCLWVWQKIFGLNEIGIRSFSAFFSSITIVPVAYYLKKNFNGLSSLFFILIYSLHPVFLFYAQEARCYSLLVFLSGVSIVVFHNFIYKAKFLNIVWLGLINFLLFYTHYLACFIIFFQFVFCLIYFRNKIFKFILGNLIMVGLILLRFTKKQFQLIFGITSDSQPEIWIKKAKFSDLLDFFNEMYFHYTLFFVLVILLIMHLYKNKGQNKILYYFIFVAFLTPLLFYLLGLIMPIFINRYILFSVLFSLILLAYLVYNCKSHVYVLLGFILLLEVIYLDFGKSKGIDYRSPAAFVNKIEGKPLVIINRKDVTELFTYYYNVDLFDKVSKKDKYELNKQNIYDANTLEDVKSINTSGQKNILLFQTFDDAKTNKQIEEWFEENGYTLKKYNIFTGVKFSLFKKE